MEDRLLAEKILDQVADAVICADASGKIIRWNSASTALFGFAADDALGQNLDLIIPEHLRAAHWKGFYAAMEKGALKLQGRPTLTRALHKSGRRLYVEMTFAIVRGGCQAHQALGRQQYFFRDATDRVEKNQRGTRVLSIWCPAISLLPGSARCRGSDPAAVSFPRWPCWCS